MMSILMMETTSNTPRSIRIFQAKEIQQILGIPKHRYEYIASKIGIAPDIEEVEGQGKAHLYSFRNLIQFAIAHTANDLGLTPKKIRNILKCLDNIEQSDKKTGIYIGNAQGAKLEAYHVASILSDFLVMVEKNHVIKWYFPQGTDEEIKNMLSSHSESAGLPNLKASHAKAKVIHAKAKPSPKFKTGRIATFKTSNLNRLGDLSKTLPPVKPDEYAKKLNKGLRTHIKNVLDASIGFIGIRLGTIKLRTLARAIDYKRYKEDPEFRKGFDEAREINLQKIEDWLSNKKK